MKTDFSINVQVNLGVTPEVVQLVTAILQPKGWCAPIVDDKPNNQIEAKETPAEDEKPASQTRKPKTESRAAQTGKAEESRQATSRRATNRQGRG